MKKTTVVCLTVLSALVFGTFSDDANAQLFRRWGSQPSTCIGCQPTPIVHHVPNVIISQPCVDCVQPKERHFGYQLVGDCKILNAYDLSMAARGGQMNLVPNDKIYIKLLGKKDMLALAIGDTARVALSLELKLPPDFWAAFLDDHTPRSNKKFIIPVTGTVAAEGVIAIPKNSFIPTYARNLSALGLLQNESFIGLETFSVCIDAVVKVDNWVYRSCNDYTMTGTIDALGGATSTSYKKMDSEVIDPKKAAKLPEPTSTTAANRIKSIYTSVSADYAWLR